MTTAAGQIFALSESPPPQTKRKYFKNFFVFYGVFELSWLPRGLQYLQALSQQAMNMAATLWNPMVFSLLASLLLEMLLLVHLLRTGLLRNHRFLGAYFALQVLGGASVLAAMMGFLPARVYSTLWIISVPLFIILYIGLLWTLYARVFEGQIGIHRLARRILTIATVAACIAAVAMVAAQPGQFNLYPRLGILMVTVEAVFSIMVVGFLFVTILFYSIFPVSLPRNVVINVTLLLLYLGAYTISMLQARDAQEANLIVQSVQIACLLAWIFLLRPSGEETEAVPARIWGGDPGRERVLLEQLRTINQALINAAGPGAEGR